MRYYKSWMCFLTMSIMLIPIILSLIRLVAASVNSTDSTVSFNLGFLTPGGISAWDAWCQRFDPASYCKFWQRPSRCHGSDYFCGLDGDVRNLGCVPEAGEVRNAFTSICDVYCDRFVSSGSVCEWWRTQPTCSGSAAPCDRSLCEERVQMSERCDRFCQMFAGSMSFCKLADNTCHGSDISCAPSECVKPTGVCDSFCESLNGQGSFCLFWRDRKQCSGGGQACDASQCF
jgi:hypothetical protein